MKTMIYIAVALILISGLMPPTMGNNTDNGQHIQIILQSSETPSSPELLDQSAKVITDRLVTMGLKGVKVESDYNKGLLVIRMNKTDDIETVLELMVTPGKLEFFATYTRAEILRVLEASFNDPGMLESLNAMSEGAASTSPILGAYSPQDAQKIEQFLQTDDLIHQLPGNLKMVWGKFPTEKGKYNLYLLRYEEGQQAMMDGSTLAKATEIYDEKTNQRLIDIKFDPRGKEQFATSTANNLERPIAVVIDDLVYMAPTVKIPITGGKAHITGDFTADEASRLTTVLDSGALPLKFSVVQVNNVGK